MRLPPFLVNNVACGIRSADFKDVAREEAARQALVYLGPPPVRDYRTFNYKKALAKLLENMGMPAASYVRVACADICQWSLLTSGYRASFQRNKLGIGVRLVTVRLSARFWTSRELSLLHN